MRRGLLFVLMLAGCGEPVGPRLDTQATQGVPGTVALTVCAATAAMAELEGWPLCR